MSLKDLQSEIIVADVSLNNDLNELYTSTPRVYKIENYNFLNVEII